MNWKRDNSETRASRERVHTLERRIEDLERRLARERSLFLDEDLRARGLK